MDKMNPAWAGSWAWNLTDGRLWFTVWNVGLAILLSLGALISMAASLAQHWALPAAVTGVLGGLLIFMASLRCQPLGSPVFRSAPIRFVRVWLSMLRLPAALSALFFVFPAGAAIAAEPSAWTLPVGGGVGLLMLNTAYAIFAGYFISAPAVAALTFVAALAYAEYETLEYGRTLLLSFIALLAWLWFRARRRFYHG
ncbi:hypothetical protein WOB59_00690 [Methylocystis sp. IM4]|uniref:hypothetical protein n=1 Tax=Methylocystis sp. IM4 TaxID=3136560 RepID=UPI00311A23BD